MAEHQLTLGGIPIVYDEAVPEGALYIVPRPPMKHGESFFAYNRRCSRMGVKLINLKAPR